MTVVVGVEGADGSVVLAADSMASNGEHCVRVTPGDKLIRHDEQGIIMGCSGSHRFNVLLRHKLTPPKHHEGTNEEYVQTTLIDEILKVLKDNGWAKKSDEQWDADSYALIGYRGAVYRFQSTLDAKRPAEGYAAIGAGENIALGALCALRSSKMKPRDLARAAVEAAVEHSPWCGLPVAFEALKPWKEDV